MTQIGTKLWYVFKLQIDLHTKINHRVQHAFFIGNFENLNTLTFTVLFLMTQIDTKFWYDLC